MTRQTIGLLDSAEASAGDGGVKKEERVR